MDTRTMELLEAKDAEILRYRRALRDIAENCTLADQGCATSGTYKAIGVLAEKALRPAS